MPPNHTLPSRTVRFALCLSRLLPGLGLYLLFTLGLCDRGLAQPPDESDAAFFRKLAEQIEPSLVGEVARLPQYVRFYRHELGNDPRLFAFQVTAAPQGEGIRLTGYVEFEEHQRGIVGLLRALGFSPIDNQLTLLPDADLPQPIGVIKSAHAFSYDRAAGARNVVTECLVYEPLFLLRREADYYLAHAGEGYLGYVPVADVEPIRRERLAELASAKWITLTSDVRGTPLGTLPLGARLPLIGWRDDSCSVQLPNGERCEIPRDRCGPFQDQHLAVERVLRSGRAFLDTPYRWGGKTTQGIDCSGLVQVAYATVGVPLPRDSNQQIYVGRLTGTRWCREAMLPGDTMYFLGPRGRIRHTAVYLGDDRYLQAAMPVVCISSLNPEHEDYDPRREAAFAFAKRPWDKGLVLSRNGDADRESD